MNMCVLDGYTLRIRIRCCRPKIVSSRLILPRATKEARSRLLDLAVDNIQAFVDGNPKNVVLPRNIVKA